MSKFNFFLRLLALMHLAQAVQNASIVESSTNRAIENDREHGTLWCGLMMCLSMSALDERFCSSIGTIIICPE